MLERLMRKAQQAEIFETKTKATKVSFEANQLKSSEVRETCGMAVRVMAYGRLGFAATGKPEESDELVTNALESARHTGLILFRFPVPQSGPAVQVNDPELAALSTEHLIEMGQEVIAIILKGDHKARVKMGVECQEIQTTLRNSAGIDITTEKTILSIKATVRLVREDDIVVLPGHFSTAVKDGAHHAFAQRLAEKLHLAQRTAELASGRMPVLFSPLSAPVLVLPLIKGLNGKNVYRGISPLADRVGEQIFDEKLAVVDDATLDGRPGSGSYDDEGVPRQRRVLIDHGVLCGFIYDVKSAARADTEPTGHGERRLFRPPSPSFSNLIFEQGDIPLVNIIRRIEKGLLVESPLGIRHGDIINGDFSNNLSLAFKIERGEIVGRVKDVAIAGNVYEVLQHVEALSEEREWVYGGIYFPYILLPELNVVT